MKSAFNPMRQNLYRLMPEKLRFRLKQILLGMPWICPQVRAWAETTGLAEIIKIYWEKHQGSRPLPVAGNDPVPQLFLENQTYPIYDRVLYRIPGVRIRGTSGILTLPDGSVCHQTAWSYAHIMGSPDYHTRWRGPVISKPGNYCTLIYYWGTGYYHWYNDVLSTLFENLELMPQDTVFLLPHDVAPHHLATLDSLGIGPERRVIFDGTEVWELENLWFQPPAVHPDDQTPGAMSWLGRTLSAALPVSEKEKPLRLYVNRRQAQKRSVINEEELLPILQENGFTVVELESLTVPEQIRLFRNAEMVVAPHGAGLTNLIFSRPGTPVLEIFDRNTIRRCYWALAHELGHSYHFSIEASVPGRFNESDIKVDPARFRKSLKQSMA